jgi:ATP-dependent Lon protease
MKRKVGFISLAGESDSKNLLGHKRVYVNSCPGVFVKELQKLGTKNPVIVLDEIDKVLSAGHKSSVFYALLQILNPEESHKFVDHYLEIPFDFSNVIFILTSNNSGAIFPALIDRMESFEIEPYIDKEKFYIAKNYMVNQIIQEFNFNPRNFNIQDETLHFLIDFYCKYESGVRRLKKMIESVVRKICFKIENNDVKGLGILTSNISHR